MHGYDLAVHGNEMLMHGYNLGMHGNEIIKPWIQLVKISLIIKLLPHLTKWLLLNDLTPY